MKSWYLIHSKPRQEQSAKQQLERQGYEAYLPLALTRQRKQGKMSRIIAPMFPRYLFIRLSDETDDWRPIRSTIGVSNLVRFGQTPARIPDSLIEMLTTREDDKEGYQTISCPEFRRGDSVRIAEGPFEGYEAVFDGQSSNERVMILLKIAEKFVKIKLDQSLIESI